MEIEPITILKCIVYPAAAFAAGAAAGLYYHRTRQALRGDPCSEQPEQSLAGSPSIERPGQQLGGAPCSEQPGQKLGGDPCSEQPEQKLGGDPCSEQPEQRLAGEVPEPRIGAKPLSDPTANDKVRKVEELQKQAEKKEHETLEESGAVTSPTDSKTDAESQAADSKPHS